MYLAAFASIPPEEEGGRPLDVDKCFPRCFGGEFDQFGTPEFLWVFPCRKHTRGAWLERHHVMQAVWKLAGDDAGFKGRVDAAQGLPREFHATGRSATFFTLQITRI